MIGEIRKDTPISEYQPSSDILEFTKGVKNDYAYGDELLHKPFTELNDRSIIEDENRGQMMFNAFVDTNAEDPAEAWKWRGTRSMARNKGIAMHANLTANFIIPLFTAQNENDEIDVEFSEVMRDVVEWMTSPTVSNYQSSFMQVVFGMMQSPVTYIGAEYCEVLQKIKERGEDGKMTTKEILDEVLSGFQAPIYSATQILITNAYERNIQRQRRIIKRRYAERAELEATYGDHPNWPLVKDGYRSIYSDENGLFYDVKDEDHPHLCTEEIALSRRGDSEVPFVNGIYMGDMSDIDANPIKHRDNNGAPKYNVVPFGYHRIGTHFYFFKSMMNVLGWDNDLYDAQSEITMNRAILETEVPVAVSGADNVDSDMIFPNAVVAFEDKDTKVQPLIPSSNMSGAFAALRETEKSISEGSVNETMSGQLPDASQKAYNVAQAQTAAKKNLRAVVASLMESVTYLGDLMKDIVINHITVPQVTELIGGNMQLKYRSFLLENKNSGGKVTNKYIQFDESLIGSEMSEEDKRYENIKLLEETGYPESKKTMIRVNPRRFAMFKYLVRSDAEEMFTRNQEYWQPVLLNLKTALANDPFTDQEFLTRKIAYAYFQSEGDDMVKKPQPLAQPGANPALPQTGPNSFGNQVNQKMLSKASEDAMM